MLSRLKEAFPNCDVEVVDLTGGSDHFEVRIKASCFNGMSRIQQHKAVMKVFERELRTGEVHALALKTQTSASELN